MSSQADPPLISVIMPVFNAGLFVNKAIDSILAQSFADFEFLIIDDCSNDNSCGLIRGYDDKRIRFIQNERNMGVARTLNKALSLSRGQFIARMDADDVSEPVRFAQQVAFMDKFPQIAICGSWVWRFSDKKKFLLRYPVGQDCVRAFLLFGNPLAHPSVFMRREVLQNKKLQYDSDCPAAQDYDLWSRCGDHLLLDNISEPLVGWRQNDTGVTCARFDQSNAQSLRILKMMLEKLSVQLDEEKLFFHREVGNGSGVHSLQELSAVLEWLSFLLTTNQERQVFPYEGLLKAAAFVWYRVCLNSSGIGLGVIRQYVQSPLRRWYRPGREELTYLLFNSILKFNKTPTGRLFSV